ncbi:hypothetical protein BJY04DRAFT_225862 [Aspergillus karnatakaensis]|uniref:uncharacterized protein n=1 Tax=Aspergillus karnatakaensis TaxID=1810916 RepID=UPI003CCE500B
MASLDSNIYNGPLTATTKQLMTEGLWGPLPAVQRFSNGEPPQELNLDAYFHFYTTSCARVFHNSGGNLSVQTHRQILGIIQQLRRGETRDLIRNSLSCSDPVAQVDDSISLAAQLLLMLNFASPRYAISGTTQLSWATDGAISASIHDHFFSRRQLDDVFISLDSSFTAYNVEKLAGIEIVWTDNLADHLRLVEGDGKVAIFHHVTFLECQHNSLLPPNLAKETLRTISLLFPQGDKQTVQKYRSCTRIDARILRCGKLRDIERDINSFFFWRDRLVILKQRFDAAHPRTINQWWRDRRNGVQWYTFWVAILILILTTFFGLVQSVEGALQVYKAFARD